MADDAALVELALPARPEAIIIARMVVIALARERAVFDEDRIADVRLAVSEACTNAVEAHLELGADEPIAIRCRVAPGRLQVRVRDHGGGFDPDVSTRSADLAAPGRLDHEGGLGIPLIRLLADQVDFDSVSDGTEVAMSFGPESAVGRIA